MLRLLLQTLTNEIFFSRREIVCFTQRWLFFVENSVNLETREVLNIVAARVPLVIFTPEYFCNT